MWSLTDHAALGTLFTPLPASNTSFLALGEIVEKLLVLDECASDPVPVRSAAARGVLATVRPTADWGSVQIPRCPPDRDAWEYTLQWVGGLPASAL